MIQAGWNRWMKTTGILCYRRASDRVKSSMMYGQETAAMTKEHDRQIEVAETRMLWFPL